MDNFTDHDPELIKLLIELTPQHQAMMLRIFERLEKRHKSILKQNLLFVLFGKTEIIDDSNIDTNLVITTCDGCNQKMNYGDPIYTCSICRNTRHSCGWIQFCQKCHPGECFIHRNKINFVNDFVKTTGEIHIEPSIEKIVLCADK